MILNPTHLAIIKRLLVGRNNRPLRSILAKLEPADLASLIGQLNDREVRMIIEALMSIQKASTALVELPDSKLFDILKKLEASRLKELIERASLTEASHFISLFDGVEQTDLLEKLDPAVRRRLKQVLEYQEGTSGRVMQTQVFSVPIHLTAHEGLEYMRNRSQEMSIYYVYCVDEQNKLVGVVSIRDLATARPDTPLGQLAKREVISIYPESSAEEAATLVSRYDFVAIPVVSANLELIGIITVDDVLDIIQDQVTANIYASAGLQQDDRVYSPPWFSIRHRLPWMFINLGTAILASLVISVFEKTMQELIALATLNNIVAGTAGNAAIQTITVFTRGLAVGDFSFVSRYRAVIKEVLAGGSIGLLTGIACGVVIYFWKSQLLVAVVITLAMFINSIVASIFGAVVPLFLHRLKLDPAAGSGVLVTAVTDSFGFFSFLGIATLGLKYVGAL